MQLTFLGATQTVTGSKYLLTCDSKKILVDCGLFQGLKELRLRNWTKLPINPNQIDAVILTHAHIDHSGYLPLLVKNGFKGKIFSSHGTRDLCAILLPDSGHLQEEDAKRANLYGYSKHHPALPLYTREEALRTLDQFHALDFDSPYELFKGFSFVLLPAGHIIGSSMVNIRHQRSILFTGDLGRPHHPIMNPPAAMPAVDYLVTESTYGNKRHPDVDPKSQLADAINETLTRHGTIVIPAFAVGRSQDVLYHLYMLKKEKRIPDLPIFLDSPMAQNVSDLLTRYTNEHKIPKDLCHAICDGATYIRTPEQSKIIDEMTKPSIIISASGMMEGGRILHHLKKFLPDKRNAILLTGYQDPGTRGDRLKRGEAEIKIHGDMIPVRAQIKLIENMSVHADYEEIVGWLKMNKHAPRKVFITHGEPNSALALKSYIEKNLGWVCNIPIHLQSVSLT